MSKQHYLSGVKWEPIVGYARAVKAGKTIFVAGTTAVGEDGELVGKGDPAAQTRRIIRNIEKALVALGSSLQDVVRTRIYVVNIDDWEKVGRAHGEFFCDIKPACTMVGIKQLVSPDMLVEIEAEAVAG